MAGPAAARDREAAAPNGADSLHRHVPRLVRHAFCPGAPAREHAVGAALQQRFDPVDLATLYLEQLGDLPGPGLNGAGGDGAPVGSLEGPRRAALVIEESEGKHDAALLVHRHIAAIADTAHEVQQPGLELLHAGPLTGVPQRGLRIRASLPGRGRLAGRLRAVLEPDAVIGERVVAPAVVHLHAAEI